MSREAHTPARIANALEGLARDLRDYDPDVDLEELALRIARHGRTTLAIEPELARGYLQEATEALSVLLAGLDAACDELGAEYHGVLARGRLAHTKGSIALARLREAIGNRT